MDLQALQSLGPYAKHFPMKEYVDLSADVFNTFHTVMGGHTKLDENDRDYIFTRLMYIAEIVSTGLRLNASWALTHAAMSLTRDRYEQTVRFSWLARQPDNIEFQKFLAYYHSRANKIFRSLKESAKHQFEQMIADPPPEWTTRPLTQDEKLQFEAWDKLDLFSMVQKRDALRPLGQSPLAKITLQVYYGPIYGQFSSVSHSDMYSVALLGFHKAKDSDLFVLAADPHWPATLAALNALFDIIQCYECAAGVYGKECESIFQTLLDIWYAISARAFGVGATAASIVSEPAP